MKMGEETRRLRFTKLLPFLFLAICVLRACALQDDDGLSNTGNGNVARVQRDLDGVTTVLLVSARSGKGTPPLGLLTKTARTFVQDGASTEYATQVLGTTLANGRLYARILSTSSRVFYDRESSASDPSSPDPFIVYPSRVPQGDWQFGIALDNAVVNALPSKSTTYFNDVNDVPETLPPALDELLERENDVFARKEPGPIDSVKFRPAKVRSADNLPTYTVKQDAIYFPETSFTKESSGPKGFTPRMPKVFGGQYRPDSRKPAETKPAPVAKPPPQKPLGTVTYHGFADFTTTVGDTVIVFSPSTSPAPVGRPATTIKGDATLRPDDGIAREIQATSVIVGHWKTQAAAPGSPAAPIDPLLDAINGGAHGPQLQPSGVNAPEPQETSTSSTPLLPTPPKSTGLLTSIVSTTAVDGTTTLYKSLVYGTYVGTDYAQVTHTASDVYFFPDEASVTFGTDESDDGDDVTLEYTESEGAPTTEQMTPEMNELTTPFKDTTVKPLTTVKQVPETLPKVEEPMEPTEPTPSMTSGTEDEIPNDITVGDPEGRSIKVPSGMNMLPFDNEKGPHNDDPVMQILPTRVPSTVYNTFTYFTTFYIPDGDDMTTTSIKANEVVSTEVFYVTDFHALSTSLYHEAATVELPTTTPKIEQQELPTTPKLEQRETPTTPKLEQRETTTTSNSPATSPATTPKVETSSEAVSEPEEEQTTKQDEEIELIFKTLYTTYTYLTTFFQEQTSSVSSREVIETNVITQTVGPHYNVSADVAGLYDRGESVLIAPTKTREITLPSKTTPSVDVTTEEEYLNDEDQSSTTEELKYGTTEADEETEVPTEADLEPTPPVVIAPKVRDVVKTYYTTYTYFTTIFVDDETEIETRTEIFTNVVTGSIQPTAALPTTPQSQIPVTPETPTTQELPKPEVTEKPQVEQVPPPEILVYLEAIQKKKSQEEAYKLAKKVQEEVNVNDSPITEESSETTESALPTTLQNKEDDVSVVAATEGAQGTPSLPDSIGDGDDLVTMVTDVISSSSSGGGTLVDAGERKINTFPDDQELSESNNHEVEPVATLLLQTSYTTFTYFTTMYKGDSSNVVSRLETVTNLVTETIRPSTVKPKTITTFTDFATLDKGGDTVATNRDETPGIDPSPTTAVAPLPSSDFATTTEAQVEGNVLDNEVTSPISLVTGETSSTTEEVETTLNKQEADITLVENRVRDNDEVPIAPDPTTFYTTYTYFTTSYVGNSTVLNSRLETITSVAERADRATGRAIGGGTAVVPTVNALNTNDKPNPSRVTGLISAIRTSQVTDGTTTHFSTDVRGTIIDGLYAQVIESSTRIEKPEDSSASVARATPVLPIGILSLNRGSIIDADEITTVYFTTRQIGTTVDGLYAKIVESTASTKIDEEKLSTFTPTQTDLHRTGFVRLIEGYVEENDTTVFYRSKVIGTSIDGRYAQIIESTSSWLSATPAATISGGLASSIAPSATEAGIAISSAAFPGQVHPSPAVVQSSMSDDPTTVESSTEDSTEEPDDQDEREDEDDEEGEGDEDDDGQKSKKKTRLTFSSRKRTFTPVIRPFASRNRPTFNPIKRKGTQGATTITRTDITPTITATLAGKGNRFASSRGRLNSPTGPYSSSIGQAQQGSGSRRFSGRRTSSSLSINPSSGSGFPSGSTRGRASSRISPSSVFPGGRGRGSGSGPSSIGSGRGSSIRPGRFSSSAFASGPAGSSRFRSGIRASSTLLRGQQPSARNDDQDDNVNDYTATTLVTEETPYTDDDRYYEDGETGETGTVPLQTTTESIRRTTNPLLRFRRPLTLGQSPRLSGTTQRSLTTTTRRSGNLVKPVGSGANRPPFSGGRSSNKPNVPISTRPRQGQQNSLFPPRGLFNRRPEPTEPTETTEQTETPPPNDDGEEIHEDDEHFEDDEPIEEIVDNDYEGSEQEVTSTNRRSGKSVSPVSSGVVRIRPFAARGGRVRRQASQLRSLTANRFRRPPPKQSNSPQAKLEDMSSEDKSDTAETAATTQKTKVPTTSRYGSNRARSLSGYRPNSSKNTKNNNNDNKASAEVTDPPPSGKPRSRPKARPSGSRSSTSSSRIKPTSASNGGRQFTLREKDSGSSRSGYKRPGSSSSRNRPSNKPETSSRPRPPRIRNGGSSRSSHTETPTNSRRGSSDSRPRRPSSGSRNGNGRKPSSQRNRGGNLNSREESKDTFVQPEFDGTITVTHYVPTEVTIPVVSNGVTERKNIITAQPSTQILGPDRYSTVVGGDGRPLIVIAGEVTGTNGQGQTEVTRYLLHESITTSITRGPTSIGGRRTTYSHVIPSTVYSVENVVSTRQPVLPTGNAPLANILLSQLLLGQLGQGNPLLGGLQPQQQQQPQQPATPSTRFDTRTTSYVTTVTKHQSTVIPLTFRGKEILTTLVDSSVDVITATEYITDTIVVTPTATLPGPDINSLLLLLQQPQQPQPQLQLQQANLFDPLFAAAPAPLQSNTLPGEVDRRQQPADSDYKPSRGSNSYEDEGSSNEEEDNVQRQKPRGRKNDKASGGRRKEENVPAEESTVVTLYVSGRRPGEFSTVLSTVRVGEDSTASRRRRDVDVPSPMLKLRASQAPSLHAAPEPIEGILALSGSEEFFGAHSPTQSLESVVDHFQESATALRDDKGAKISASRIIADSFDEDDDEQEENEKEMDVPIETEIALPNITDVDNATNSSAANRPRKRLRVRVPVSRTDANHKVTVVLRRLLGPLSRTQEALPTPRRFVVTRVRTPGPSSMIESGSQDKGGETKAEFNNSLAYRHKVTVTRLRKIQPTSSEEESTKPRVTRKKLVNVRPVLVPTPTPTSTPMLAIITTGFYASSASNEDSDDDADDYEDEEDISTQKYHQDSIKNDELSLATPSLDEIPNTIESKLNEIASRVSENTTESNLVTESQSAVAPVILTDHFFLPSDEEEDYYDEDEDVDDEPNPSETEKTMTSPTSEHVASVKPDVLDSGPSVLIKESPPKTLFAEESYGSPAKTPSLDVPLATKSEQVEFNLESTNSLKSDTGKTSVFLNMDDGIVEPPETLKNSSASAVLPSLDATRIIPSVSPPILEDAGAGSFDDSLLSFSHASSVSNVPTIPEDPTSTSAPEPTVSIYYSETVVTSTRLRTYTYVVTKLNGLQTEVTSSTAVRPKVTILTLTVPVTATLPHAAVATSSAASVSSTTQPPPSPGPMPTSPKPLSPVYSPETIDDDESAKEDPEDEQGRRFNLATRRMSNGVQVIVAGPTPAPAPRWETASPPATLTLSDAVVMLMPRDKPQEFVTKTCATTFTYLTTFTDQDGSARVSTKHQVVYNTATEERQFSADPATPATGFTLEASPTLGTEVFETTYAYLDLPVDSRGTTIITNTVTAPQRYLDLVLEPSEAPLPETNTYLSTRTLERTITENGKATVHAVNDVVTRLVVTESARSPRPSTSVNVTLTGTNNPEETPSSSADGESDVVKTYYVTYSYYSTFLEQGSTVVRTNIATSSDVVTEKAPGRRTTNTKTSSTIETQETPQTAALVATPVIPETPTIVTNPEPIQIFATKTYLTTFTYFTTLLQAGADGETSTTVSSRSQIVENVVTESIAPSLLDAGYMNHLLTTVQPQKKPIDEPSDVNHVNNVVTGSTIIFFDEEDRIDPTSTSTTLTSSATETVAVSTVTPGPETNPTTLPTTGEGAKVPEGNNDAPAGGSGSFGTLGPFGSFGINGLSALGPVITAMAGLLQGKTTASRRNGTSDEGQEHQDTTTQRSPIYIPVAEFADGDIETAESQNIGNRLANLNRNYIPETRHKSSASLVNGIPISPGEVITANSDVIIGKPGKIGGPRPPQSYNQDDEHVGIRPPPPPSQALLKPAHPQVHRATPADYHETQLQILPARQVFEEHLQIPVDYGVASSESHQIRATPKHPQRGILRKDPGHDVMVNDPLLRPPASPGSSIERGKPHSYADRKPGPDPNEPVWSPEKYRRPWSAKDPLKPSESHEASTSAGAHWIRNDAEEAASSTSKVHGSSGKPNSRPNHHDYQLVKENHERPPWAQRDPLLPTNTIVENSQQPKAPEPTSIIRHVVPHVIDRDTGQPLLVNIQPSQVANVVIPQGGNQALIFGDTNEPHITGQYFDDPSPYPEPEVAPGFVGVQKVEHSPQYFSQDNPSEYMVPPPSPQINFKPLQQSPGSRPPTHHERPGHLRPGGSYNQIQRRPAMPPATSPPRRTEVETPPHHYILLGNPGDTRPVNELSGDSLTWKLKTDRKPVPPQSTTQSPIRQRPSGQFGSAPNRPAMTSHNHDIYIGRPGTYPTRNPYYPSVQPPLPPPPPPSPYRPLTKKPDANLVPPNWTPPKNSFNRDPTLVHTGEDAANNIIVTITDTVSINPGGNETPQILHPSPVNVIRDPEAPHYHHLEKNDQMKIGTTESSAVHQSTGENIPTGAVGYHDPSTDPKVKPEDTSYYPRIPTVKPEVQSFGQILPQAEEDGSPEIWTVNTQTERSSLSNDSEISESQGIQIQTNVPTRGDMPPEIDNDTDSDSVSDIPFNYVTPGTKDAFDSVGSVTTIVGKPLEAEQAVAYGQQQQKKHEQHQQQQHGQNNFAPNRGVPFANQEPAIVQGVPFRQKPYERPLIVKGKPFGVYVDGHVNVGRPYGYDQRETRRPPISHDVVQGVPFGHHGNQKVPHPTVHEVGVPPRKENVNLSTSSPLDRNEAMDLKPPPVTIGFHQSQHQQQVPGQFAPNRNSVNGNDGPEPNFARPEAATLPPPPSSALSPPAKPDQMNKDFNVANGNMSRPNSMGSGNYFEDDSGSELNLAESSYQLPHPVGSNDQSGPEDESGSFNQGRPTFLQDVTRPRPSGNDHQLSHHPNDRVELEFSMPVEATGDDNEDSDTQTERPPSMFSTGTTTTRKTPTQLVTLPTSLAAPPPTGEVSINRKDSTSNIHDNNSHPVTQDPVAIPQPWPRPRVPYRDMMPPPLRPAIVFHGSKGTANENKGQGEGLEPPPLPTDVVGLSPPPSKYIPLEESTTAAARPFLVELLSQDMVPPAPVIETLSRPVPEVATVRPAVAVSGSIRIATSVTTSRVPLVQDIDTEAEIPVVHGTVDLPVIIEMHGPPPSSPSTIASKTSKTEHVSIYTARPFESRPASRISIQPTTILSTNVLPSSTTLRPLSIDNIVPSRSSTSSVIVKPTRLSTPTSEYVTDEPTTTKRPGRPVKPVFLQPSKDTDIPSPAVQPTQSLGSIHVDHSSAVTKYPTKIHEKPTKMTTIRTKDFEVRTTTTKPVVESPYSKPTTGASRTETERETVLYVVTTRVASVSSSTTRTLLLTRTLTSTTVETVTETLLQSASPTTIISSSTILRPINRDPIPGLPSENESIFVVMSDQNPPEPGAEEVEAEYGDMEATRDEQDPVGNTIQKVVLSGVLGAPVFPREPTAGRCLPECRASKAEVCSEVDGDSKCVCRPGFARMFLDRPCKPIYTYTLRVGLDRVGKDSVSAYAAGLNDTASNDYQKLAGPTKEALDRTMMQSDLRDLYRGLDVARFTSKPAAGVEFHVQFSENANETRLKEVVRKYLVGNNYSLGGTEVYASRDLDSVEAMDFDECATEVGGPHHDCSPHAACFNLRGSYQCSCREGWTDLSENLPAYPGRVCSQAPLGCPACNNKGHCIFNTNGQEVCECFPWHSGQRCQVNVKVLLIALVTTGLVLLVLLGACVGLACLGKPGRRSGNRSGDRRAMISGGNGGDTSSEGSAADLATIPHHVPHVLPAPPQTVAPAPPSKRPSGPKRSVTNFAPAVTGIPAHPRHPRGSALLARPRDSVRSKAGAVAAEEQRDRSLTVMIPRAKYRSAPQSPQSPGICKPPASNLAIDERKLISYLEGGPRPETRKPSLTTKRDSVCKEIILDTQQNNRTTPTTSHLPIGALVSAGFQVSATVTRPADAESTLARSCGETTVEPSTKILRSSDVLRGDLGSTLARSCGETTIQAPTKLLRMDLGEAGSTLARSCGETTIQPPTKMAADRRSSREPRDNASDGHTMAERDVGGTLRMPAQRPPFYDPDRASDRESNFDSL